MSMAAMKTALSNCNPLCFQIRVSLFHSTPVLSRRKPTRHFGFRNRNGSKRYRKNYARESMVRSLNGYTDFLFKSWRAHHGFDEDDFRTHGSTDSVGRDGTGKSGCWDRSDENKSYYWLSEDEDDGPSSSRGPSWFTREFAANNSRRARRKGLHQWGRRGFQFCESDEEVDMETMFRSAFNGNGFYSWTFVNGENHQRQSSSRQSERTWHRGHRFEQEHESESDRSESDFASGASERLALGLSAYGPIKLEEVKTAYRSCALKWHPDRHQGSSKAVAEEKFKLCSAAYQSLCDKLEVD